MAKIKIQNQTVPAIPDTGYSNIYVDSADKKIKIKDDAGDVHSMASEKYVDTKVDAYKNMGVFGSGSDGDVIISTDTTLTRDMYYNNLTINATKVLNPNGYRIFVKNTFTNNGIIRRNGNNGSGGTGGAALNAGSLNAEVAGGNGGYNVSPGPAGESFALAYTNTPGTKGADSFAFTAGNGGTATIGTLYNVSQFDIALSSSTVSGYKTAGASSGGGGGGFNGGANIGGGAGGNGGIIRICAYIFNNNGLIESIGGNGGVGGGGINPVGGGAGGQGGVVWLSYHTLTALGTITLTGGNGVAGANNGPVGANGNAGTIIQIQI